MKILVAGALIMVSGVFFQTFAQNVRKDTSSHAARNRSLFIDVHQLEPGKVKYEALAEAHKKDLAVEGKYGVHFINYWVDEDRGQVYCLSSASDTESIRKTHAEAHG